MHIIMKKFGCFTVCIHSIWELIVLIILECVDPDITANTETMVGSENPNDPLYIFCIILWL